MDSIKFLEQQLITKSTREIRLAKYELKCQVATRDE